eukprot:COSAG06_NODE_2245_length_7263_cov_19.964964_5_plen_282_part_00
MQAGLGEYDRHGLLIHPDYGPRVRIGKLWTDLPLAHDAPRPFGVAEFCEMCDRCATACPAQAISYGPRHTVTAAAGAGAGAGAGRTVAAAAQEKTTTKKTKKKKKKTTTTRRKTEKPSGAASSEAEAGSAGGGGGGGGGGMRRSGEYHNVSNLIGVSKWTTNAEKCFSYWTQSNAACSVCIRVCPYNRTSDGAGSGHGDRSITIAQRVSDSAWRQLASSKVGRRWCQRLALAWDDASGRAQRLRPATWWKLSTKGKGKGNKQQPQQRGASGAGAAAAAGRQ